MVKLRFDLDRDKDSPSDYAILVRNVPKNWSQSKLLEKIEELYSIPHLEDNWDSELKKEFRRKKITDR
jgi:hypothetical protein